MNYTHNRYGQRIPAVGAPNSYMRLVTEERFEEVTQIQTLGGNFRRVRPIKPYRETVQYCILVMADSCRGQFIQFNIGIFCLRDSMGKLWYWEVVE